MNVCHGGSSILTFREAGDATNETHEPLKRQETDYCRSRERIERAAAKRATSMEARRVHQELAQAYARIVGQAGGALP
jgi:hypothetical protein